MLGKTSLSFFFETRSSASTLPLCAVVKDLCSKLNLTNKQSDKSCYKTSTFFFFFFLTESCSSPLGCGAFPQITLKWTVSVNTSAHIRNQTVACWFGSLVAAMISLISLMNTTLACDHHPALTLIWKHCHQSPLAVRRRRARPFSSSVWENLRISKAGQ